MKAFFRGAAALIPALCLPSAAHAQPGKKEDKLAIAQTLYEQATAAMDEKDYEKACPKLEEVVRLIPEGLGAKLTLAECYEAMGRLATAWTHYLTVEHAAAAANQKEREQKAAARAAQLKPKLATLSVDVPEEARSIQELTVRRDDIELGEVQWGVEIPVDAGRHTITARAPGYSPWKRVESIADGEKINVVVSLIPEVQSHQNSNTSNSIDNSSQIQPDSSTNRSWQRPLAFVALGLGGAGLVAGSILGGLTISKYNASVADYHCDINNTCDAEGLELRNQAIAFGNGSTVAFIAGGALAAAGAVLWLTAPSTSTQSSARLSPRGPRWTAQVRFGPNGLQCLGSF